MARSRDGSDRIPVNRAPSCLILSISCDCPPSGRGAVAIQSPVRSAAAVRIGQSKMVARTNLTGGRLTCTGYLRRNVPAPESDLDPYYPFIHETPVARGRAG